MRTVLITSIAICLALALGACGGDEEEPKAPRLSSELVSQLASQSEAVADSLEAGDDCLADSQAAVLRASIDSAIAGGGVPDELAAELRGSSRRLASQVECAPEPVQEQTTTAPAPDCEALEEQLEELEEQRKKAEENTHEDKGAREQVKERFEERKKELEEQLKACEEGEGGGEGGPGRGLGLGQGGGPPGQDD